MVQGSIARLESFKAMFHNPIFLTALISFVASQLIKGLVTLFKNLQGGSKIKALTAFAWDTGGFPSSHSALVSSLASATAIYEGFNSTVFIITLFYAFITMRDALGVRRSAGLQAKSLNELGAMVAEKLNVEWKKVKEIEGHNPLEVMTGVILGVLISLVFAHFYG